MSRRAVSQASQNRKQALRNALLEKFKAAYGSDNKKNIEVIEFVINTFFNNFQDNDLLDAKSINNLKTQVLDVISKRSE